MKRNNLIIRAAIALLLCVCFSSCHLVGEVIDEIGSGILNEPDYDASFTINGEKTKQKFNSSRLFSKPSASFNSNGKYFNLVFSTSPYYLDTSKALSSLEFSVMMQGEPEIGREYRIKGHKPDESIDGKGFGAWEESGLESWVMCKMMWAPMCKFLDNKEIAKAHPNDRIILASESTAEGWIKFEKINYITADKIEMWLSFELTATVSGGDNGEVTIPVTLTNGKLNYHNCSRSGYVSPVYTPWFMDLGNYVPKDYFLSMLDE